MKNQCCNFCGNEFDAAGVNWSLDNNLLVVNGVEILFTATEAELFDHLFKNIGKSQHIDSLITALYGGYGSDPDHAVNGVKVYASRVRKKLAKINFKITNIPYVGYALKIPPATAAKVGV